MRSPHLPALALGVIAAAVAAPVAAAPAAALAAPLFTAPMVLSMSFEQQSACNLFPLASSAAPAVAGTAPTDINASSPWAATPLGMLTLGSSLLGALLAVPMVCARARGGASYVAGADAYGELSGQATEAVGRAEAPVPQPAPSGNEVPALTPAQMAPPMLPLARRPAMVAYANIATDTVLAEAGRLATDQATPAQMLEALQAIGLPIQALPLALAGVASVTGNSVKGWNEDTALAFRSSYPVLGPLDVLMAFDGMGGLRDGKLASKFAALAMAIELHRLPDTLTADTASHLAAAFERVNRRFRKAGAGLYGHVHGDALRSTAIVLLAEPLRYVVAHQGDGHAMLRRSDGDLVPLMQAHKGAASNAVTHSLGPVPDGEARVVLHPRLPGDLVFIASDGFDPVPSDQLLEVLHAYGLQHPLQAVVDGLTDDCCRQCDERGPIADDNMSLAALRTPGQMAPREAESEAVLTHAPI